MRTQSVTAPADTLRASRSIAWAENGLLPDPIIRLGIRRLNRQRLHEIRAHDIETASVDLDIFAEDMRWAQIAPSPELANEQHYEVPPEFFALILGPYRKYSCCFWDTGAETLEEAEEDALRVTCERARITDGLRILELGCGWGALTLWIATHFPRCQITAVTNSIRQKEFIIGRLRERGIGNVTVLVRDMNDFYSVERFDRIISIEMFEHMRNYPELFRRIASWLKPRGLFFLHSFCHRSCAYEFVDAGPGDWMSRHFFAGGMMPSDDLPLRFQRDLNLQRRWRWSGRHYEQTANAWLANMDRNKTEICDVLRPLYGSRTRQWTMRWRIFFMACAELFGHAQGREWYVSHYLFARTADIPETVGEAEAVMQ